MEVCGGSFHCAKSITSQIEPSLDLPAGVLYERSLIRWNNSMPTNTQSDVAAMPEFSLGRSTP